MGEDTPWLKTVAKPSQGFRPPYHLSGHKQGSEAMLSSLPFLSSRLFSYPQPLPTFGQLSINRSTLQHLIHLGI
jgi:hypothetical protein